MLHVLRTFRPPLLLLFLFTLTGALAHAQVPDPISGIDDTPNTQWTAQTVSGAGFGVANVMESSQPYTHTTDGQSIRFDLFCATSPCTYGYTHTYNPSYGTSSATDAATSITNDLMAELDSVGVAGSQALEFGLDQSLCTANCTSSPQYTRFRYAMQCDFKDTGKWRVWDANSGWVATSNNCVAFTSLVFVHFTFHYSRPDLQHVQYTDFAVNGTTYPINMTQAAQSLGSTATHEFIPWVNLDGDRATDPYSMWVDQWSISYNGGCTQNCGLIPTPPQNAVLFGNLDDDPINTSDPTNPPNGQWGYCISGCGGPTQNHSLTHVSSPSVDGQALDADDSGTDFWGILYFLRNGPQNFATNYEVEWTFQLNVPFTDTQAIEFDFPVSISHQFFYWGSECDPNGFWRIWNPNNSSWNPTSIACPNYSENQWHTVKWYGTRTSSSFTYVALEVDGVEYSVNVTYPATACCNTWSDQFIVQFQPDGKPNTGYSEYVDSVNAWLW